MSDRQGSDRVSRFRYQNQNTIQELAGRILDNLSANLSEAAIVTRGRGLDLPGQLIILGKKGLWNHVVLPHLCIPHLITKLWERVKESYQHLLAQRILS